MNMGAEYFRRMDTCPSPDGTELGESDLHEPSLSVEEEVPENLGGEWRVLHPFELPGV